ncbi:MAG: isoprenylcysteine carboxylmethyltransferase family protein [Candidatus Margulisbacteria bacterium]|nr:isoprenylcysteine carboxylmethyltransferase family protein [Candidatus Margulisiibacteriota bacterium]
MSEKLKLTRSGYKRIITVFLVIFFNAVFFFAAAGRIDILRAWVYFVVILFCQSLLFILLFTRFPEMAEVVNARGEMKMPKVWDRVFALLYTLIAIIMMPIVAGLDVGRYGWSELNIWWLIAGLFCLLFGLFLSEWALIENRYFELGVRIQKERGQKVVSTGPYAIVRHPGYIAFILLYFSFPMIVGSYYALYASLATAFILVVRTALEDATLQKELAGYVEYTKKTRFRLIPFVW